MVDADLRTAPGDATPELRDRPVPGVLQRTLEQPRGVEDVRFDQAPHARITLGEGRRDRLMLLEVEGVELVELCARRPDRLSMEDAPRALRGFRELANSCRIEVDVVELSVCPNPLGCEGLRAGAGGSLTELAREPREALLGPLEPAQIRSRQSLAGELGGEAFEGCADDERLEELGTSQRLDLDSALAGERNEPERRELSERFPNRRAADAELLRQLLLPKEIAGRELPREDRVLQDERDLVSLGCGLAHAAECSCRPFSGSKKRAH